MRTSETGLNDILFGKNQDYREKLNTDIYFGSSREIIPDLIKIYGVKGKVLIFAYDNDYLFFGRKIKEKLDDRGLETIACTFSVDMLLSVENVGRLLSFDGVGAIIAVGEEDLLGIGRYFATLLKIKCLLVPVSPRVEKIFSRKVTVTVDGKAYPAEADLSCSVIIDADVYSKCKKQYFAEAYGNLISRSITLIDYKIAACLRKTIFDKAAYEFVRDALGLALNVLSFEELSEGIILAELKLAIADRFSDILSFGSQIPVAEVLGRIDGGSPEGIRRLEAFYILIKLYYTYFANDFDVLLTIPDFYSAASALRSIFNEEECDFIGINKVPDLKTLNLYKKLKTLVGQSFLKEISGVEKLIPHIKNGFSIIFNARKQLAEYSPYDLKRAVLYGSYLNDKTSVLNIMRNEGILEYIKI